MAIYCNTLEGNMQYGDDPYCFTPNTLCVFMYVCSFTCVYFCMCMYVVCL